MLHHIIVKFNENTDKGKIANDALNLFKPLEGKNGIKNVTVKLNCIDKANRFDMAIIIDMDKDSLDFYDHCEQHLTWKKDFAQFIQSKTIIDFEN